MKKFIMAAVIAMTVIMAMPTVGMAATKAYMTTDITARADTVLTGSTAPKLIIESSDNHTGDLNFVLDVTNAEWTYEGSGTITTGIEYTMLTSKSMIVTVDFDVYDPNVNDIIIPMETEIEGVGVASVTINPKESTVSAGTYVFAHVGFPAMSITVNNVDSEDSTFDISFIDDYPYTMANGRLFKLTLSNGYIFDSFAEAEGTDKYAGKVDFTIDQKNKTIAYVEITQTSLMSKGTMTIKGIKVNATDKAENQSTYLYVEPVYGSGGTLSFPLTGFQVPEEVVRTDRQVLFTIGKTGYVVDEYTTVTNDMMPFVDVNGRTMLPLRALANAFNIADDDIEWNEVAQTVKLTNKEDKLIVVTIGQTELKVGAAKVTMDTTAVIKDNRTYLPMRAVLNALGIEDDDIVWDDKGKTVLVYDKEDE